MGETCTSTGRGAQFASQLFQKCLTTFRGRFCLWKLSLWEHGMAGIKLQ